MVVFLVTKKGEVIFHFLTRLTYYYVTATQVVFAWMLEMFFAGSKHLRLKKIGVKKYWSNNFFANKIVIQKIWVKNLFSSNCFVLG